MARQFIYHMQGLSKTWPGGKKVLDNVHLSFYPDAKIGVLGVNGSGKSTLLRIMAGLDKEFSGEGFVAEGARSAICRRSRIWSPTLTFAKMSCWASPPRRTFSTATTISR